jgi:hypothetical protein
MRTPTWCRAQAADVGPACVTLIGGLLEVNALFRLRAAQGVLGLATKYGTGRLERACALAVAVGDPSYRTIKGILLAGTESEPAARATGDGGAAAHLHGPEGLFANVVPLTSTSTSTSATAQIANPPDTTTTVDAVAATGTTGRSRRGQR